MVGGGGEQVWTFTGLIGLGRLWVDLYQSEYVGCDANLCAVIVCVAVKMHDERV